jgi:hypothetical protein
VYIAYTSLPPDVVRFEMIREPASLSPPSFGCIQAARLIAFPSIARDELLAITT